jgi:hypothetical protein
MSKKLNSSEKKRRRLVRIVERDGDRCWFCDRHVPEAERSLYHLRARFLGGSGEQTNQVMTCEKCALGASTVWPIKERVEAASGTVRYRAEVGSAEVGTMKTNPNKER